MEPSHLCDTVSGIEQFTPRNVSERPNYSPTEQQQSIEVIPLHDSCVCGDISNSDPWLFQE